ncbi:MAG: uncharacterized protein JWR33_2280 [Naasia sp.]|jgi:hypothetical protein|uniref:pilus assembly protein TadG-related protein n=1 Tax=Naasia sp. TaxID=2546198 RepID=UPI00262F02A0|nr:pilus assembly protein TadG-related protein [Naasia sp.]MCU1571539.1 uncharacterized protein [Naasia sp.]
MRRAADREEGSILPLLAGFFALTVAVILLVTAASSLYLERKRLLSLADAAALAAAESFPLESVSLRGDEVVPLLTDGEVRSTVERYLASMPESSVEALRLEDADTPDGRTATVALSGRWRAPLLSAFVPAELRIEVTATARTEFR